MTVAAKDTLTVHLTVQEGRRSAQADGSVPSTRTAEALACGTEIKPARSGDAGAEVIEQATRLSDKRGDVTCTTCLKKGGA